MCTRESWKCERQKTCDLEIGGGVILTYLRVIFISFSSGNTLFMEGINIIVGC